MDINKVHINNEINGFRPFSGHHAEKNEGLSFNDTRGIDPYREFSTEDVENIMNTLNSVAKTLNKRVNFSFNEKTNRIIMKVVNSDTNEVIREIPSREMIRLLEHFQEMLGMFIDESR